MNKSVLKQKNVTILDLVDRILAKGALLDGDITISVADVDLIYVGLKALLASVETARHMRIAAAGLGEQAAETIGAGPADWTSGKGIAAAGPAPPDGPAAGSQMRAEAGSSEDVLPRHVNVDPEGVEHGLAKLVLTLIELLRRLMERQALRRIEGGSLTDGEVERLGTTFMRLAQRMDELKGIFGLADEDLNLNLGPLGDLI